MGKKITFILVILVSLSAIAFGADKRFTLVIDAGHGGHDSGAKGAYSYEKNINLNVALAFGRYVEDNCPDVKVVYTRKTDVFVPLHRRADIANKNKADVFISIHTNALPKGHIARGLETYTMGIRRSDEKLSAAQRENSVIMIEDDYEQHYEGYDPNSPESAIMFEFMHDKNMAQSVELAKYVQTRVCATAGRPNKGVKQDVFLVLRETSMPACLIELGFITTPDEEKYLNNKANVDKIAKGIYEAFAQYKAKYDKSVTVPYDGKTERKPQIPSIVPTEDKPAEEVKNESVRMMDHAEKPAADEPERKTEDAQSGVIAGGNDAPTTADDGGKPVFKVQILAGNTHIPPTSSHFKGLEGVESYEEGGLVKYTYGASTDYNEIYRLRKSVLDKFPEAFIIAFKDGKKTDIRQAISEFKSNK